MFTITMAIMMTNTLVLIGSMAVSSSFHERGFYNPRVYRTWLHCNGRQEANGHFLHD
jgi:hypothetical protein